MSLDFSEVYRCSGPKPVFSPNGRFLASAVEFRLVVRDVDTLHVVHLFACLDTVEDIQWASDSNYVLCGLYKRAMVQAWCMDQPDWTCKIDEGPAGISHARWTPDGRQIITVADFNIRLTVWSLVNKSSTYLKAPKFPSKGLTFSPDGGFMALAERRECKDFVSVFSTAAWKVAAHFPVATEDLADISWSPDGGNLAVWDTILEYRLLIYTPDGRLVMRYQAYENALGLKNLAWSPSGQLLAVGSYDQMARVFNHITWKPFAEFSHPANLSAPKNVVVYMEAIEKKPPISNEPARSRYTVCGLPQTIPNHKPPNDKPNPKLGIGTVAWSGDNRYLVTRNDNMPTTVWIWDMSRLELATVLIQIDPVKSIDWDPVHCRLALCTGGPKIFLWAPEGSSCVHIPLPDFQCCHVKWNPTGTAFVLTDRETYCCAFLGTA
mmetsp:Transcript_17342/g.33382  ORF Transcript_17342/g.33382 Transcript_17342/m.33382 type:complete len:435 (-) Transcript_17342:1765-3069(-)|eukprot:CAMPEP_0114284246 /NCGR_PEP_ID=MMETSP0059-20121206/4548_1 /TAXON_ID=36894 /ORGANISM="Pyramimonas parkeae, Strain CCMP726" /LENGTH=434 /DNA_ID=CAMNT_0001405059 /DNA_START=103 /DNA_END=1407 /DNA_ORIENTATION=-